MLLADKHGVLKHDSLEEFTDSVMAQMQELEKEATKFENG